MKIRIELNDAYRVFFLCDDDRILFASDVEVSQLFYNRYKEVMQAFSDLQDDLEAIYALEASK
jgi:hypothetical protein